MPRPLTVAVGQKYNRLEVVERVYGKALTAFSCRCECGALICVNAVNLKNGHTKSCGCLLADKNRELRLSHGHTANDRHGTKTYKSWLNMKDRCSRVESHSYPRYGGRGIKVCSRWMKFENFLADMGEQLPGMSIDRIDNNGNYEPQNCRWATKQAQANNRRTSVEMTAFGKTQTLAEWSREIGISQQSMQDRIRAGGTPKHILRPRTT